MELLQKRKSIIALSLVFLITGLYNYTFSQGSIAFSCTPPSTGETICQGETNLPDINNCIAASCPSPDNPSYCWWVKKPNSSVFVSVSGSGSGPSYQTVASDYNGNPPSGTYTFKRWAQCEAGCDTTLTTNAGFSNEVTVQVIPLNTVTPASSSPVLCVNTTLTPITHTTTGATGISNAGIPGANGLPTGVSATWAGNVITITGTPTSSGTFTYSIPLTGGCGNINAFGTITVTTINTVTAASSNPTLCVNTALTPITHVTTGASGISNAGMPGENGLPAGVSATFAGNVITISGQPTSPGTFSYSIPLTGGCGNINAIGTITVSPINTVATASSTPTLCVNTALAPITHVTSGATGINNAGVAGVNGLPPGVSATWVNNLITISGTPTSHGTFNYQIPLTGGCGSVNAVGTIVVNPTNTAAAASTMPSLCINTTLTPFNHATTGATGISGANNLPAGVIATWANNTITISGTPIASGPFTYSIPLTGGCGNVNATGIITVSPLSEAGTLMGGNAQVCVGTTSGTLALSGITGTVLEWQKKRDASPWTSIANTGTSLIDTIENAGTWQYRAIVKSGVCPQDSSSIKTIDVAPQPSAGTITINSNNPQAICAKNDVSAMFGMPSGGFNGTATYQYSKNGTTFTTYNPGAPIGTADLTNGGKVTFKSIYTSSSTSVGCNTDTKQKSIDIYALPVPSISGPSSVCEREAEFLQASGGNTYKWFDGTQGNTIGTSSFIDGPYSFIVTVTDGNGCSETISKSVEVKNVPVFNLEYDFDKVTEGRINFYPSISEGIISEINNVSYKIYQDNDGKLVYEESFKTISSFYKDFLAGIKYRTDVEVSLVNGCIINKSVEFTVNPVDCDFYTRKIKINKFLFDIKEGTPEFKLCDNNIDSLEFTFTRQGLNNVLLTFNKEIYEKSGANTINVMVKKPSLFFGENVFQCKVFYTLVGGAPLECNFSFIIIAQEKPRVVIPENKFCFGTDSLKIDFNKIPINTTFRIAGSGFSEIKFPVGDYYSNDNKDYTIQITDIKAEGNVCPTDTQIYNYTVLRSPEVNILPFFCSNDSSKQVLKIDPRDSAAKWNVVLGDGTVISTPYRISGSDFGNRNTISAVGRITYPGNFQCKSDSISKTVEVRPLPVADIGQYIQKCGPFYKAERFKELVNSNSAPSWTLENSNQGFTIIDPINQIIAVTKSGNLKLTLEKNGCYHHDTINVSSSFKQDTLTKIDGKICNDSTLFYVEKYTNNECYRWFYINPDGDIKEINNDKVPYFKTRNDNKPLLVRFDCNSPCGGTIVTNRSVPEETDCEDKISDTQTYSWDVMPIPTFGDLSLYSKKLTGGNYTIQLNDAFGRVVKHIHLSHNGGEFSQILDVSDVPSGYYFLSFQDEVKKVIIVK